MSIHFQSITEKLTPHDTIFSFTSSAELNDNALSSSCSLHTASASIKSSNDSLRQRGLAEIAEDARENHATIANSEDSRKIVGSPELAQIPQKRVDQPSYLSSDKDNHRPNSRRNSASPTPSSRTARTGSNADKALPPTPAEPSKDVERPKVAVSYDEFEVRPSVDERPSSQSLRPATRDLHSAHVNKPKTKLGPRPSTDTHGRQTATDSSSRAIDTRPISTLPTGLRMPARKAVSTRPKSQQSQTDTHSTMEPSASVTPPVPSLPSKTPISKVQPVKTPRRPTSGIKVDAGAHVQTPSLKSPTMTPEKRRLMKALQLRQKQMAARSLQETYESEHIPTLPKDLSPIKTAHEDSVARTSFDVFSVDEDSNIIHVGTKLFDQETPINSEASPISITEPSDGPSTQASSVSDEEEGTAKHEKPGFVKDGPEQPAEGMPLSPNLPEAATQSFEASPIHRAPAASSSVETPIKENRSAREMPRPESPADEAPFRKERDLLHSENDIVEDSAPTIESSPKKVPSLAKLTSDSLSPQEVALPAISEDEDSVHNPLGLSYSERNALLPFLQQDATSQAAHAQLTSHSREEEESWANTRPSTADTMPENRYRRHGLAHNVKRVSEISDDNFLSDDSFMEELKCAVVQEAKPISVSKSPITPVFPRTSSDQGSEQGRTGRSVSNPLNRASREDLLNPNRQSSFSPRSFSIPESQNFGAKPAQVLLPTKVSVSSGISQRIKALEKLSSRPPSPSGAQLPTPATSPPFINLRKSSLRSTPAPPDPATYSGNKNRQSVPYPSPTPSPEAGAIRSHENPIQAEASNRSGKTRPESISVTARIIRGGRNQVPEVPLNPSEPCAVDLYHSPLIVDRQPKEDASTPTLSPLKPPTRRWASNMSISSSSTEHQSEPSKPSRRDSFMSRRSASSRRGSDVDLPQSISETSLATLSPDGKKEDKKDSKKSRLFKRMSNISSASRRSIVQALSPSVKEESIAEHYEPVYEAPKTVAEVGDVNIQFPDTLVGDYSFRRVLLTLTIPSSFGNADT